MSEPVAPALLAAPTVGCRDGEDVPGSRSPPWATSESAATGAIPSVAALILLPPFLASRVRVVSGRRRRPSFSSGQEIEPACERAREVDRCSGNYPSGVRGQRCPERRVPEGPRALCNLIEPSDFMPVGSFDRGNRSTANSPSNTTAKHGLSHFDKRSKAVGGNRTRW